MADADEVDTDEELRDAEVETTLAAGPALEVDTDEELKKKAGEDMPAQILWGSYQSAKVKTVQQGMYHVKFDDGASRWATCSELVLGDAAVPVHLLQDGMPILRPEVDDSTIDFAAPSFAPPAGAPGTARSGRSTARSSSTTPRVKSTRKFTRHLLLQGKLKRRVKESEEDAWEVQTDDAEGTVTTHAASELRLPVAYGLMLGSGGRLSVGTRVHALRGEWRSGTLHGGVGQSSQTRGRSVTIDLGSGHKVRTWVPGGQVVPSTPADPSLLAVGSRVVAHIPSRTLRPFVEAAIEDVNASSATCVADDGARLESVPIGELFTRLDTSFRVLAASAGFQRATIKDFTPDGMYAAQLSGGSTRWVSACELTNRGSSAADRTALLDPGTFVAVVPERGIDRARWLSGALVVAKASGGGKGSVSLRRPRLQKPLTLTLERREGRFGIGLDEDNRVLEMRPGCSAIDAGVRVGDKICKVDGVTISSPDDLATATQGKESIEIILAVDRDGGEGGGDADGDGEVDDGADGAEWHAEKKRVLLPLMARGTTAPEPVGIGDEVFVLVGGWREALVEVQDQGRYLLHHGRGEKRWADGGEIAWHDIAPMQFDVAEGKPLLAYEPPRDGGKNGGGKKGGSSSGKKGMCQSAFIDRQDGAGYVTRFDSGAEHKLELIDLRERWTLPLRVLGLYGDYKTATVLESLGGILRVQFAEDGHVQWALPDEVLADPTSADDPLGPQYAYPGSHVAVLANWKEVGSAAADEGSPAVFRRATYVAPAAGSGEGMVEIAWEDNDAPREIVPLVALRRPRRPEETSGLVDNSTVLACRAQWLPGIVNEISDDHCAEPGMRISANIFTDGRAMAPKRTSLSRRGLVTLDAVDPVGYTKLKRGSPMVVRHDGEWQSALLVKLPGANEPATLMSASGHEIRPDSADLRGRIGAVHPVEYISRLNNARVERFQIFQVIMVQRMLRGMLGRKKAESAREDMWGATMIQSRFRGKMLRSRLRREKEEKAAITIEAHQRGHMARVEARALRTANADAESLRRENAAVVIQSHERGRVARAELQTLKQQRAEEDALKTEKAIVIQAHQRGHAARVLASEMRRSQAEFAAHTQAALVIQAHERGRVARALLRKLKAEAAEALAAKESRAATTIQAHARRRAAMRGLKRAVTSAILIQAHARGRVARKELSRLQEGKARHDAAATMQARVRMRIARAEYRVALGRIVRVQTEARRASAERLLRAALHAAIRIETFERRRQAMGTLREAVGAATVLESYCRGARARAERRMLARHRLHAGSAIMIQRHARGLHARRELRRALEACAVMQKQRRMVLCVRSYRVAIRAAVHIQAHARGHAVRVHHASTQRHVLNVQTETRRWVAQVNLRRSIAAATCIAACGRGLLARRELLRLRRRRRARGMVEGSLVTMQRHARGLAARRRTERLREARAATRLTAISRGVLARRRYPMTAIGKAVVTLQSHARRRKAQRSLAAARGAATAIEAGARGQVARAQYRRARRAANALQAVGRGMLARRRRSVALRAVRTVQGRYRDAKEMRRLLSELSQCRKAATRIQASARARERRKAFVSLRDAARAAEAKAKADKAAALAALRIEEDARLHIGLQRTDAAAMRRSLLPSGPPDVLQLYNASSSDLAAARRRRMPQAVPTSDALSPRLLELEPKAMLARLALEQAQIAKDPLRNGKYDTNGLADPSLLDWLGTQSYRGKPAARRARGRELGL